MQNNQRKLLILDLDETLIHATENKLEREPDFIIGQYSVYKRPFLKSFLDYCFEHFVVAVWTNATKYYAEEIMQKILNENQNLKFLWTRERCTFAYDEDSQESVYVKKMHKIRRRGYDLKSVIVVDDSPNVWRSSYGNLVRIKRFEGSENDKELKILPSYLEKLKEKENIRLIEKRGWRNNI